MADRTRYSDEELAEFKDIILKKLEMAKREYNQMMSVLTNKAGNDVIDTSPTFKVLEEGSITQEKEELTTMCARQQKFIRDLQQALVRIENKTYGVCRVTGKLIPKERLRIVPHATLSIEAKEMLNKQKHRNCSIFYCADFKEKNQYYNGSGNCRCRYNYRPVNQV